MQNENCKVSSLQKAMTILECFLESPKLGVTEISRKLHLNKSNVHDILSTFKQMGYVEQEPDTGKYYLGLKFLDYSHFLSSQMSFRRSVMPHMQELASQSGETVFFGICDAYDVVYLDGAFPPNQQNYRTMFGFRAPLYCTGLGKAILSTMTDTELIAHVPPVMKRFTENTICDMASLQRELKTIRQNGFSFDNMEHEYGIMCVAKPLYSVDKVIRGGISLSGPSLRFSKSRIPELVSMLNEKCEILRNII